LLGLRPPHRFSWNSDRIAPVPGSVMCGKAVRMSPRQPSTSRKHAEGNADYAVEQRPPLAISTGISPAKQQHQAKIRIFSPVNSGGELHLRARQSASRGLLSTVTTLPQTASFKGWWAMRKQNCKSFPLRHHLRSGPRSQPQLSYKACGGKATTFPDRKALPAERQHLSRQPKSDFSERSARPVSPR
jgi:hypothetical protein